MSTPSRYVDALMAENVTWPVLYDDLSVYVQYDNGKPQSSPINDKQFWTGYYTSRPAFKR